MEEGLWDSNGQGFQMCRIHGDFKHFALPNAKHFRHFSKVSSIMSAKVLSIMLAGDVGLTRLFKAERKSLG
jgi:hypothetical protein